MSHHTADAGFSYVTSHETPDVTPCHTSPPQGGTYTIILLTHVVYALTNNAFIVLIIYTNITNSIHIHMYDIYILYHTNNAFIV